MYQLIQMETHVRLGVKKIKRKKFQKMMEFTDTASPNY